MVTVMDLLPVFNPTLSNSFVFAADFFMSYINFPWIYLQERTRQLLTQGESEVNKLLMWHVGDPVLSTGVVGQSRDQRLTP